MNAAPEFGFKELFTHVVGDMAKAISERNGESKQQQFIRSQAAVHMIMGFLPRDVIEALLAGHCVMFHEVMTDSILTTLRGEPDATRARTRGNIVALNKVFFCNLDRLERYQSRPAEGRRDEPEAPAAVVQSAQSGEPSPVAAEAPASKVQETPVMAEQRIKPAVPFVSVDVSARATESPSWTRHGHNYGRPNSRAASGLRCDQPPNRLPVPARSAGK